MSNQVIGDLLCLILDLNPVKWSQSTSLSLDVALNQILIFANSHLAIRHENQIALFAATQGRAQQLYSTQLPPIDDEDRFSRTNNTNIYQQFRIVDELVTERIKKMVKETTSDDDEEEKKSVNLVGALSMALCRKIPHPLLPSFSHILMPLFIDMYRYQSTKSLFLLLFNNCLLLLVVVEFSIEIFRNLEYKSPTPNPDPLCNSRRTKLLRTHHELYLYRSKVRASFHPLLSVSRSDPSLSENNATRIGHTNTRTFRSTSSRSSGKMQYSSNKHLT